ncbi:uncharacterized protein [Rutidosis leptorrhynchoides]|uniref:uncharacterized protein n=1 Tax=Rutidosis leptorrhynchoides TaxID=125765 RepID=UPI003A99DCC1
MIIANPRHPEQKIKIGGGLSDETKFKLRNILTANADVFAWKEADMTGVPREIAEHKLNANPNLTPVRQKKRGMAPERSEWLKAEVDKLVKANILREVRYQTWVANPVLVKKPDVPWRMCVDFIDISKACPKDNYPLPEIDWKVESLAGFRYKCFLDAAITTILWDTKELFEENGFQVDGRSRYSNSRNEKTAKGAAYNDCANCWINIDTISGSIKGSNKLSSDSGQGTGSELNYPAIEKLVYALVHTARRLRRYFQAHPIRVLTDQPIKQMWEMHTDGACGPEGAGAGIILKSLEGKEYTFALRFSFPVTNNEAKYEALLSGMRVAKHLEVKELSVYVDSQLVANQFNGIFEAHDESMQKYLKLVQELAVDFDLFQITQISRTLNKKADALSKLAALTFSHFKKEIWVEEVKIKTIEEDSVSATVEEEERSWMTPIIEFLANDTLPIDSSEARKIKMKAPMYLLDKGILYIKSFLGPHLRCLNPTQAESIIREVHEGMCALHSGTKQSLPK